MSTVSCRPSRSLPPPAGFTLVELMVVIAILAIVMGALYTSLMIGRSSYLVGDAYIQVQQEARHALDAVGRELRSARDPVVVSNGGATLTFQLALGYNLSLDGCQADSVCWGAVDTNGVLQPDWEVRYRFAGTQLLREVLNGGAVQNSRVLANDVTGATFNYNDADNVVQVNLSVSQVSGQLPGGSMPVSPGPLATRVTLRN